MGINRTVSKARLLALALPALTALGCNTQKSAESPAASESPESPAPPALRDFSFGHGTPFLGSTPTDCGPLTLSTTNTEPFASASFRNNLSGNKATVKLEFPHPIAEFHLAVSYVRSDEYLAGFNVQPSKVSGTLVQGPDRVSTSQAFPADDGAGMLSWLGLNTEKLEFVVGGPPGTALALDGFQVSCRGR